MTAEVAMQREWLRQWNDAGPALAANRREEILHLSDERALAASEALLSLVDSPAAYIGMMGSASSVRLPTSEQLENQLIEECQRYDVVIFDTNPALDYLPVIALRISNLAIIPTLEKFADASQVDQTIHSALRANPNIVYRILPTKHDRRTREGQMTLEELHLKYQGLVLDPIPEDVLVSEAPRNGLTILEYAPSSNAAMGYFDDNGERCGGYNRLVKRVGNYLEGMQL